MAGSERFFRFVIPRWLHRMALATEELIGAEARISARADGPHLILAYRGYGTSERVRVIGRVVRDRRVRRGLQKASAIGNLRDTWRRLSSAEVPNAVVDVSAGHWRKRIICDDEGYIDAEIPTPPERHGMWVPVNLELIEPFTENPTISIAECLVPSAAARFGVISDIDDTIVETGATNVLAMFRNVALQNARTRTPFARVAELYDALSRGRTSSVPVNPLFYVSSGPWNFYDVIDDFLSLNSIPQGPVILQDYGFDEDKFIARDHAEHKLSVTRSIFESYPELPFVLIGDSGQRDPEIYETLVREHPERVKAIFIRDVTRDRRDREIRSLAGTTRRLGVEIHLVSSTDQAWETARKDGLI